MNWASVFDEIHPQPGATDAVIEQFVVEVASPTVHRYEVREVTRRARSTRSRKAIAYTRCGDHSTRPRGSYPTVRCRPRICRCCGGPTVGSSAPGSDGFQFFPALNAGMGSGQ